MMKVGFIGVGYMGRHMARNVAKGGHHLTVFDMRKEAAEELLSLGASWADSPQAVAAASEVVFTSLPRPQDVEEVATGEGGILQGAASGTAYFDLSTTDPDTIRRISEAARGKGVTMLDAPVSGGTAGAEKGTLCVMVGGDEPTYQRYKAVLDLIGDKVMYCGDLGAGAVCKIVNNLIGLSVGVVLSEAFTVGVKAGVPPETLFEAVSKSSGNTQAMQGFPAGLFKGNFEPGFQLDLAAKDVGLATEMGRRLRVPMDLSNLVQQRYIDGQNSGWGRMAAGAVARVQEKRAGVEVRT
ncbi:MAG: NAD(P)-dependent oxidoreductase [Chloroflexi bacterium]|nr:NAD(P)-dependent oxidoreductase [Chloroflexota bacterium]